MKRVIAIVLSFMLCLTGCGIHIEDDTNNVMTDNIENILDVNRREILEDEIGDTTPYKYEVDFALLDNSDLHEYIQDNLYLELVSQLNSEQYLVENISTVYISQEYIEELTYNSQPNIYFGYTLEEIDKAYQGTRYVFTVSEEGNTIVVPLESYDTTYEQVLKNVAVGTGVILICVTVSAVSAGVGASAISMIFAASAKTGTMVALSSGGLGAVASGIVTGMETGDMEKALKVAALSGSEGFKWGAITGVISGGATEVIALKRATLNGLTMNEAALIQKESGFPIEVIEQFHTLEEYNAFKAANLKTTMVNGKMALVRDDIDLNLVDEAGHTNLERMKLGLPALDETGKSYELHHIGQSADGTLAILTQAEHDNVYLHGFKTISEIDRKAFVKQRKNFWKTMATLLENGGI